MTFGKKSEFINIQKKENEKVDNQERENLANPEYANQHRNSSVEPVRCIVNIHDDFITTAMKEDFKECGLNTDGSEEADLESLEADDDCVHEDAAKINYEK